MSEYVARINRIVPDAAVVDDGSVVTVSMEGREARLHHKEIDANSDRALAYLVQTRSR